MFVALRSATAPPLAPGSSRKAALKASQCVAIASSPYATRRDSAFLDAAIIEILVDHSADFALKDAGAGAGGTHLACLAPGTQLQVSEPVGAGFASILAPDVTLPTALEESRALLLLGCGARGAAPLRCALEWQPVAAAAGVACVSLFLQVPRAAAAPYVPDWDRWREAGVRVRACFEEHDEDAENTPAGRGAPALAVPVGSSPLEEALLRGGRRMAEVCGAPPAECTVLLAALPQEARARITRELLAAGFDNERILFAEPY